jgi:hypothetical protein
VYGQSDGLGGAGVEGFADANSGVAGVYGRSNKGIGVWGVNTSANGIAMFSQGNAIQSRDKGGWVKAMAKIDIHAGITHCYNGQTGSSTGDCGFTATRISEGTYNVDFGFPVGDRFVSVSSGNASVGVSAFSNSSDNLAVVNSFHTNTGSPVGAGFYIFVY